MATRLIRSEGTFGRTGRSLMSDVFASSCLSRSLPGLILKRSKHHRTFTSSLSRGPASSQIASTHLHPLYPRQSCSSRVLFLSPCRFGAPGAFIPSFRTRCFSVQPRHRAGERENRNLETETSQTNQSTLSKPLSPTLEAARERTKAVRERVRSSLTGLTTHENIWNIPNLLTVSRLIAAPVTAYLLLHDHYLWAMASFAYAGITDLIDGWMARRFKLQTVAGSVMDPMADKALMIIVTVTLAVKGALPLYLASLILGRDASLAVAAIYYRYASLPAPKTFMRYWDFSLPSAEVHPTTVSKYNTFLQLLLIGSTLALPVVTGAGQYSGLLETTLGLSDHALRTFMTGFQFLVAGTTAWSGLSYAFLKDAVTILGRDEKLKAKQGARGRAIIGVTFGGVVAMAAWFAYQELGLFFEHGKVEADESGSQLT